MPKLETDRRLEKILAEIAFDLGMVKFEPENPFELTSGKPSPIYIDGRLWTQSRLTIDTFLTAMKKKIKEKNINYDILAGGSTAGIPYAERLACSLGTPSIYVRKEPKGHGKAAQIEGSEDLEGARVLLVEDLITTGGSKLNFIEGIRRADGKVEDCLVFFDREQGGKHSLKDEGVSLHGILTLSDLIEYGSKENKISEKEVNDLEQYIQDPEAWEEKFLKENPDWSGSK